MRKLVFAFALVAFLISLIGLPWRGDPVELSSARKDAAPDASTPSPPTSLPRHTQREMASPTIESARASGLPPNDSLKPSAPQSTMEVRRILRENPYDPELRQRIDSMVEARGLADRNPEDHSVPALVLHRTSSGCFSHRESVTRFALSNSSADASQSDTLSAATIQCLRDAVFRSRPGRGESMEDVLKNPDAHLRQAGLTPEFMAAHRDLILDHCIRPEWRSPTGELPAIPPEVERLLSFDSLKFLVVNGLLASSGSTEQTTIDIEIPGDPWIALGTDSDSPDGLPWYVRVGTESWYSMDRELARSFLEVVPSSAVSDPVSFTCEMLLAQGLDRSNLRQSVGRSLFQTKYESLPGYESASKQFVIEMDCKGESCSTVSWPMELTAKAPSAIDIVCLESPACVGLDWFQVLDAYSRAEQIVASNAWLTDWKRDRRGYLALHIAGAGEILSEDPRERLLLQAWHESELSGEPQFRLECRVAWENLGTPITFSSTSFKRPYFGCAGVILSASGAIVHDCMAGSPLEQFRFQVAITTDRKFVLVRPGSEPELRTLAGLPSEH